jgi:hypothetical protein
MREEEGRRGHVGYEAMVVRLLFLRFVFLSFGRRGGVVVVVLKLPEVAVLVVDCY